MFHQKTSTSWTRLIITVLELLVELQGLDNTNKYPLRQSLRALLLYHLKSDSAIHKLLGDGVNILWEFF